jgi:hypothetical protein
MGWMNKLFGSEEEVGPEEAHRRTLEAGKESATPAKKAPAKKAASGGHAEHAPAAKAPAS